MSRLFRLVAPSVLLLTAVSATVPSSASDHVVKYSYDGSGNIVGIGICLTSCPSELVGHDILVPDGCGRFVDCWGPGFSVSLSPQAPLVVVNSSLVFNATGGDGSGYSFLLAFNNSGGSISAQGVYVAGPVPGTDVVQVSDAAGRIASTTVSVVPTVTVSPANLAVPWGGLQQFAAQGGTGDGYTWRFTASTSGGTLTSGGLYTAGMNYGRDTVQVTDSAGNHGTAEVTVYRPYDLLGTANDPGTIGLFRFDAWDNACRSFDDVARTCSLIASSYSVTNPSDVRVSNSSLLIGGLADRAARTATASESAEAVFRNGPYTIEFWVNTSPSVWPDTRGALFSVGQDSDLNSTVSIGLDAQSRRVFLGWSPVADVFTVTESTAVVPSRVWTHLAVRRDTHGTIDIFVNGALVDTISMATLPYDMSSSSAMVWNIGSLSGKWGIPGTYVDELRLSAVARSDDEISFSAQNVPAAITPPSASVEVGTCVHFIGFGPPPYTWSLLQNESGGSLTQDGLYTAGFGSGSDIIQLVSSRGGTTATANIQVYYVPLAITPSSAALLVNETLQLAGSGSGPYIWALSSNNSGGSITADGLYTAGPRWGTDVIELSNPYGYPPATAFISVLYPALAVIPSAVNSGPGVQQQFSAIGGSGTGFTWSLVQNQSGGSITAQGAYITGSAPGVDIVQVVDSVGTSATASILAQRLIPVDADSRAHVYVSGGTLVDLNGNYWASGGTPLFNTGTPVFRAGAVESVSLGSGWFKLGSGSDVLDFTGDFSATFVLDGNSVTNSAVWFADGSFGSGYYFSYVNGAWSAGLSGTVIASGYAPDANAHVVSLVRAGSQVIWKVDKNPATIASAPVITSGSAYPAFIGSYSNGSYSWPGRLYEMRLLSTGMSSSELDALHTQVLGTATVLTDSATVAAWRFDGTVLDDVGSFPLSSAGTVAFPSTPSVAGTALHVSAGSHASTPSNTALRAYFQNEWTMEGWLRVDSTQGAAYPTVWSFAQSSAPANRQALLYMVPSTRQLYFSQASGTGVLDTALGSPVPNGRWSHVAIRKRALVGGSSTYDFFQNGLIVGSATRVAPGGDAANSGLVLDFGNNPAGAYLNGALAHWRFSHAPRSDQEVYDYYRTLAGIDPPTNVSSSLFDVGTALLYLFDGYAYDSRGRFDLTGTSSSGSPHTGPWLGSNGASLNQTGSRYLSRSLSSSEASTLQSIFSGEHTVEGWLLYTGGDTYPTVLGYCNAWDGSGFNRWFHMHLSGNGDTPSINYEAWAGGARRFFAGGQISKNSWYHFAYRRKRNGDGTWRTDVFLNGVLVGSDPAGPALNPNPAASTLVVGTDAPAGVNRFLGRMDTVRVSNVARSDAEIWAFYQST